MHQRKRAKPNTPERYLWRKPGARHLWFRCAVPRRYWQVEPKRIIQRSLGTTSKRDASLAAARLRADLHAHWNSLLSRPTAPVLHIPSEADLKIAATEIGFERWIPTYEMIVEAIPDLPETRCAELLNSMRSAWRRFYRTRSTTFAARWDWTADNLIRDRRWCLPKGSETYEQFLQMIAEAALDAFRMELDAAEGDFSPQPQSPVVLAGKRANAVTASSGETIAELFEAYATQRLREDRKRLDTLNQDRKIVRLFADFVGQTRAVASLTQAEVRDWRDILAALPPKYASSKAYQGLTLKEAATTARSLGAATMSLTTVNKYLSTVSPFLAWCVRNGFATRNPCDGLFYDLPKGRNARPPFTPEQIAQIFHSPLFTGFAGNGREHVRGPCQTRDWRFWIPLLCLYTGARIGEIAQLALDDIDEDNGVPFIMFRHDEKKGQFTKSGQSRVLPIHPELAALGFLRFVDRKRNGERPDRALFPEIQPNERGHKGARPSRFLRTYLKRIAVKAGKDGLGSHSFRHTLADRLRASGHLDTEIKVALGHEQKSVTSSYGKLRQGTVKRLNLMLASVSYKDEIPNMLFFEEV